MNVIKCPNCGSTAQVGWVWGSDTPYSGKFEHDYVCGCGCEFTVVYTATQTIVTKEGVCNG